MKAVVILCPTLPQKAVPFNIYSTYTSSTSNGLLFSLISQFNSFFQFVYNSYIEYFVWVHDTVGVQCSFDLLH